MSAPLLIFPLVLRGDPSPRAAKAEMLPFPFAREAGRVERVALHLRALSTPTAQGDAMKYLVEFEFNRLLNLGVEIDAAEACLVEFVGLTWQAVHNKQRGGAA